MRFFILAFLPVLTQALSWSAFDLGLYGIYPTRQYVSSKFSSPSVKISQWDDRCNNNAYIFLTPRGSAVSDPGPVMLDARGNLVWMETQFGQVMNFQVQRYRGNDYLTFWCGTGLAVDTNGSYYLLDSSYEIAYTVSAVELHGDLHEFKITDNDTALITIYQTIETDCTDLGLGSRCWINDCLFQEIDIETGNLLFKWRASDHVSLADSFKEPSGNDGRTEKDAFDFFHINSVDKDPLGNYYISSRHLHTVFCIGPSGDILWSLGGKHNKFIDLSSGSATNFAWQHHANWHPNNTLTIFNNNGNNVFHDRAEFSRGMSISLDVDNMTATLLNDYVHPEKILAISQGSVQVLPDNNVFVGWGNSPVYTEFSADGEPLCDIHFGACLFFEILDVGLVKSYRSFKSHWTGLPKSPPDIAVTPGKAFVSWNGATEVATWRLESAQSPSAEDGEFVAVEERPRKSFETSFDLRNIADPFVRVTALDATGKILGCTEVAQVISMQTVSEDTISTMLLLLKGYPANHEKIQVIIAQISMIVCLIIVFCLVFWMCHTALFKKVVQLFGFIRRRNSTQYYELLDSEEGVK
ncbi:ASST-domain-containing protein [Xylogone sp. PMI_703]|nr:ASST-domain-containing protein [Xylogone sp. PMI_703]